MGVPVPEQPGGLINFCDELAGLVGSFDRYSGRGGDRAFWLELYGGRPIASIEAGIDRHPYMAVSVLGTIQSDRLSTSSASAAGIAGPERDPPYPSRHFENARRGKGITARTYLAIPVHRSSLRRNSKSDSS